MTSIDRDEVELSGSAAEPSGQSPCSAGQGGDYCAQVLDELFAYLDSEATSLSSQEIERHLRECSPCMNERDIEAALKRLVRRSCGSDAAPQELRVRIVTQITQFTQVTIREV